MSLVHKQAVQVCMPDNDRPAGCLGKFVIEVVNKNPLQSHQLLELNKYFTQSEGISQGLSRKRCQRQLLSIAASEVKCSSIHWSWSDLGNKRRVPKGSRYRHLEKYKDQMFGQIKCDNHRLPASWHATDFPDPFHTSNSRGYPVSIEYWLIKTYGKLDLVLHSQNKNLINLQWFSLRVK